MIPWETAIVVACVCLAISGILGFLMGTSFERAVWRLAANRDKSHYCDGEFYAVMTEERFLAEYQRKPSPDSPEKPEVTK